MSKILLAAAVAALALVGGAVTSAEASGHGYGHRGHHGSYHRSHHGGHYGHHRHHRHAYHGHRGHYGHAYRPSYGHGFHGHYAPACKVVFDGYRKVWVKFCGHGHQKTVEAPKVVEKAPEQKAPEAETPPVEEQAPPVETPPTEELK